MCGVFVTWKYGKWRGIDFSVDRRGMIIVEETRIERRVRTGQSDEDITRGWKTRPKDGSMHSTGEQFIPRSGDIESCESR